MAAGLETQKRQLEAKLMSAETEVAVQQANAMEAEARTVRAPHHPTCCVLRWAPARVMHCDGATLGAANGTDVGDTLAECDESTRCGPGSSG